MGNLRAKPWLGLLVLVALLAATPSEARRRHYRRHRHCSHAAASASPAVRAYEPPAPARGYHLVPPKLLPVRRAEEMSELNLLAYNLLNLGEHVGKFAPRGSGFARVKEARVKEERFRAEQGAIIQELGVDIGVFPEVETKLALEQFDEANLENAYRPQFIRGNDIRGIDIGWLMKRDLPFEVEFRSNKHLRWRCPQFGDMPLFSRDLPVLILRLPGEKTPFLILLGTHYKSKRNRDGDYESRKLRRAQVDGTVGVIHALQREFGADVPIVLAGDANGEVHKEAEFANLKKALDLQDAFDLVTPPLGEVQRVTHTYHPKGEKTKWTQLDVFLLTPSLKQCVKTAFVYRYKDEAGREKRIPRNIYERKENPSDHFPIFLKLDMDCLRKLHQQRKPTAFWRPDRADRRAFSLAG